MPANKRPLELFKLFNHHQPVSEDSKALNWAQAFDDWIAVRRASPSPYVGNQSYNAWQEFLAFTGKPPWEIETPDVEAYIDSLQARGLRAKTIAKRLSGLSSFYTYCQEQKIDPEWPAGFNPVKRARKPKVEPYQNANYLSRGEETALLEAIRQDPSVLGKRDYALFLTLLRTGWKATQVRELRWGELSEADKGRPGKALSRQAYAAILDYLQAAGRLETIHPEDVVFAPARQALVREPGDQAEDWEPGRPLSRPQLLRLLKLHARRAGLKAEEITCHTLRHTAAMRRMKTGKNLDDVATFLGMNGTSETCAYLKRLKNKPKERLNRCKRTGKEKEFPPSRSPHRARPRNHLGLTHGLYARYLPEFEQLARQGVKMNPLEAYAYRWRVVVRRAANLMRDIDDLDEAMRLLDITGTAAIRLAKTLKLIDELRQEQLEDNFLELFEENLIETNPD